MSSVGPAHAHKYLTTIYCDKMAVIDVSFHKGAVIDILLMEKNSAADNVDRLIYTC
jgi:hypothetical protein